MTIQQHNIQRIRVYEEPNGSFAVDGSGTLANYYECPFIEGSVSYVLERPQESPAHLQQHIDGKAENVLLPKRWTLDVSMNLETVTTKAGNNTTIAQSALGTILKSVMGDQRLGVGDLVNDASATTTSIDMTDGTQWKAGAAIGFLTGSGGTMEIREIEEVSTNTITLKHALSSAPANTSTGYAAATYSMGKGNGDTATSLQFLIEGLELNDRFELLGGQLRSMGLELQPGTIPKVSFSFEGVQWWYADGTNQSADLTASALATSTYANNTSLVVVDSELRVLTVGTATLTSSLIHAPSITVTPNIQYGQHKTPAGVQTVKSWIRQHAPPVLSGGFTSPYQDQTWYTARDNRTDKAVFYQIGTSATDGGVLISAPTVQITNVQRVNLDGIAGEDISWEARLDTDTTESTATDLGQSAFRIHFI